MKNHSFVAELAVVVVLVLPFGAAAQAPSDTTEQRADSARSLETVTVSAIRSRSDAAVSAKTLSAAEIQRRSFGQDVPLLLQGSPSLTSYSETGNYWGYSYIRLRGIDQSRINLTLDGIPLNDPEDQVLYFADFPDLATSINSVQMQRGVGSTAPGTASYGGSINFETVPVATSPRFAQLQLQGGSFGSMRGSVEYATGPSSRGFSAYGRASALSSNGYRRHSGTEGRSGLLSAAYARDRDLVKLTAIAGLFADTLAYVGASRTELSQDRRFNPLRGDEVDRFGEQLVALSYTRFVGSSSSVATTVYRTSASGDYDVCIASCDQPQGELWNFNLDFTWYGFTSVWTTDARRMRFSAGVNANNYARDHSAYARSDMSQALYVNTGHKDDASAFAKLSWDVGAFTLFGDVQGRRATFRYAPDIHAAIESQTVSWSFLNPKAGATVRLGNGWSTYVSYGVNSREPARSDMLGGFDNLDTSNVAFVGALDRVRPEQARDLEVGVRLGGARWSGSVNGFLMRFHDEILPIGQLTYIGTPLRTNVRSSSRRGVELDVAGRISPWLDIGANATVMQGRISAYTDAQSGQYYRNVEPLLTPRVVTAQQALLRLSPAWSASLGGRYSSRSFLTNTGDPNLTLPASYVADAGVRWHRGGRELSLHVNNLFNSHSFGSGHLSGGEARYYVLPPLNLFLMAQLGT